MAGELTRLELAAQRYREAHAHAQQLRANDGIEYVERIEQCSRAAGALLRELRSAADAERNAARLLREPREELQAEWRDTAAALDREGGPLQRMAANAWRAAARQLETLARPSDQAAGVRRG